MAGNEFDHTHWVTAILIFFNNSNLLYTQRRSARFITNTAIWSGQGGDERLHKPGSLWRSHVHFVVVVVVVEIWGNVVGVY